MRTTQNGNMNTTFVALAILLAAGLSPSIFGQSSYVVLGPSNASNGPLSNGSAPINTTTSEAAIGSGAWQANDTAASQYYLYSTANSSIDNTNRGLGQLTISDLNSLNFSTFLSPANTASSPNWYLIVYTAPYAGGEASWYGNRLILEPYLAANYTNPANQWVTWSTASGANQLRLDDTALSGNEGFYGEPTLANIQSGSITWSSYTAGGSSTPIDYASQNIEGIVLSTGSAWAGGFTGMVDNVNINTTQGNVQFDLEAVPEPTTLALSAVALLLLPFTLRRRKNRTT